MLFKNTIIQLKISLFIVRDFKFKSIHDFHWHVVSTCKWLNMYMSKISNTNFKLRYYFTWHIQVHVYIKWQKSILYLLWKCKDFFSNRSRIILSLKESTLMCLLDSTKVYGQRTWLTGYHTHDHTFYNKPGVLRTHLYPELYETKTHDTNKFFNSSCMVKIFPYSTKHENSEMFTFVHFVLIYLYYVVSSSSLFVFYLQCY